MALVLKYENSSGKLRALRLCGLAALRLKGEPPILRD
jgi:hypothetical protein